MGLRLASVSFLFLPVQVTPKFCKQYAHVGAVIQDALRQYRDEVSRKDFPSAAHTAYRIDEQETEVFLDELARRGFSEARDAAHAAAEKDRIAGQPRFSTPDEQAAV
eukprot:TRINITY_DN8335_c0_g1_i1.p1 TRINITY_DN8335_c0_g1~~TRINITY_DN8335_c0_g1_i1.p1  ORF type:complete len:107 (-),score=21.12 TRINITY_DN8335_c0_g1_i1:235-555(-)